jgi:hypothetical protein
MMDSGETWHSLAVSNVVKTDFRLMGTRAPDGVTIAS